MAPKAASSEPPAKKKPRTGTADASKKPPKAVSQATFRKLEEIEKSIYQAALEAGGQITFKALQEAADVDDTHIFTNNVNALIRKLLLTIHQSGPDQFIKAVPLAQAKATGNLEDEVRLVLTVINDASDMGIWKRTLKTKTALHAKTLNNCLRELEGRKLVKIVKGVKYPTRKLYMAYDTQPSVELTGGPWYTDERDLDSDLIQRLLKACETYIETHSCVDGKKSNETMYPKAHWPFFPTLWHIRNHIKDSGLLVGTSDLNDSDFQDLLDILVADGKIESTKIKRHPRDVWQHTDSPKPQNERNNKRKRKHRVQNDDDSDDIDEEDSSDESDDDMPLSADDDDGDTTTIKRAGPPGSDDYVVYRTSHVFTYFDNHPVRLGVQSGTMDGPCGICPIRQHCDNSGRPRLAQGAGSVKSRARKPSLALVIPGASDYGEGMDGIWRGGGTRGDSAKGQVNPEDCVYFTEWMAPADAVPAKSAWQEGRIAGYTRDPYAW